MARSVERCCWGLSDFGLCCLCVCLCGWVCWIVGLLDHEDRLCTARGISVGHDVTQKLTPNNIPTKFNPAGRPCTFLHPTSFVHVTSTSQN
jgi:hypothetical protein